MRAASGINDGLDLAAMFVVPVIGHWRQRCVRHVQAVASVHEGQLRRRECVRAAVRIDSLLLLDRVWQQRRRDENMALPRLDGVELVLHGDGEVAASKDVKASGNSSAEL